LQPLLEELDRLESNGFCDTPRDLSDMPFPMPSMTWAEVRALRELKREAENAVSLLDSSGEASGSCYACDRRANEQSSFAGLSPEETGGSAVNMQFLAGVISGWLFVLGVRIIWTTWRNARTRYDRTASHSWSGTERRQMLIKDGEY
jgi:hypothetical protein